MRKNKKLLLGGLSVLTLVAAGSGAVSTFAWFQAGAAVSGTTQNHVEAGITVTQDVSVTNGGLNLVVHLKAVADDGAAPILTTNDNGTIKKGNRDAYGNITTAALASEVYFKTFTLKAWATSTETTTKLAAVKAAMGAAGNASVKADFYIEFDDEFDNDDGDNETSEAELNENEVYYYTSSSTISSYDPSSEATGETESLAAHKVQVTVANLLSEGNLVAEGSAITVGHLAVRLEGGERDHTNGTTYSTQLKAVGGTFNLTV